MSIKIQWSPPAASHRTDREVLALPVTTRHEVKALYLLVRIMKELENLRSHEAKLI